MLDCCKKNKWFYFGLTIPSMLLYVLALAGPLLLGTLPASFYNWNLIKGNKDFVGLGNYTKLLGDETFIHSVVFTLILAVMVFYFYRSHSKSGQNFARRCIG